MTKRLFQCVVRWPNGCYSFHEDDALAAPCAIAEASFRWSEWCAEFPEAVRCVCYSPEELARGVPPYVPACSGGSVPLQVCPDVLAQLRRALVPALIEFEVDAVPGVVRDAGGVDRFVTDRKMWVPVVGV